MIIINLQSYGDFDMPFTELVLAAPSGYDRAAVREIAKELQSKYSKTRDPEPAIQELKKLGFKPCSDINLRIGGGL